jgi:precorrin-2 dehydrogenase / sirohydrochlorin ferrochelatase
MATVAQKVDHQTETSTLFPMFVKLQERRVLVVGAGKIGEPKIRSLLETGACIRVVALAASEAVREWSRSGLVALEERGFAPGDLDGAFLSVIATSRRELNEFAYAEAQKRGVLCNVVDVPEQCDFYYPAVVRRGDLQIAISTSGQSPALARHLREQLEWQFGPGYAEWVSDLGKTRRAILESSLSQEQKRELLMSLAARPAFEQMLAAQSNHDNEGDAA